MRGQAEAKAGGSGGRAEAKAEEERSGARWVGEWERTIACDNVRVLISQNLNFDISKLDSQSLARRLELAGIDRHREARIHLVFDAAFPTSIRSCPQLLRKRGVLLGDQLAGGGRAIGDRGTQGRNCSRFDPRPARIAYYSYISSQET